jgi:hypothetical protein
VRFVEVVRLFGHVELTACIVLLAEAAARADRVAARVARDAGPPLPGIRWRPALGHNRRVHLQASGWSSQQRILLCGESGSLLRQCRPMDAGLAKRHPRAEPQARPPLAARSPAIERVDRRAEQSRRLRLSQQPFIG